MEPHQLEPARAWRSVIQHLRFPFSFLLLPVFLYANWTVFSLFYHEQNAWILFLILHLLVYPSSNAFNSLQDRDEGPIGLVRRPLPVTRHLRLVTILFDVLALALCSFLNLPTLLLMAIYIVASRLYSWRPVRLKRYPVAGFLTVFFCQGALVYAMVHMACDMRWVNAFQDLGLNGLLEIAFSQSELLYLLIASLFIGSMYPLSQIYQHEQDQRDGVYTISALLGYRGTFLFSGAQFLLASALFAYQLQGSEQWLGIVLYGLCQLPVIGYFLYWLVQVERDHNEANFRHTMRMNLISAVCMNLCFILFLFLVHFGPLQWTE